MKCFFPFKGKKSKSGQGQSAPELGQQEGSKPENSGRNRVTRSAGPTVSSSSSSQRKSIREMYEEKGQNLRAFTFSELRTATNNFNRLLKIGEGGFGSVYKGSIKPPDGQGDPVVVAIKKLNKHGLQGHKQWLAEVQFLGVVDHPNLVKLLGYCSEDTERGMQRLLVYEYMPNKSLEDHLFSRAQAALPWKKRLEIILGAAEGMAYLHEGLETQVIYRDFKTSNILLDENLKPKLSDFGLAREGPAGDRSHVSTDVVGTYGYAAPEYVDTGHLTSMSDIYSFGVVLYEILSGRRTIEKSRPPGEQKLLQWVKQYPADSNGFIMIMDVKIRKQYSLTTAKKIAKLADSCLSKNPKDRPTMSQVVESLKQAIKDSDLEETSSGRNTSQGSSASNVHMTSNRLLHQAAVVDTRRRMPHSPLHPRDTSVRV